MKLQTHTGKSFESEELIGAGKRGNTEFITFPSPLHHAFFRRVYHTFKLPGIEGTPEAIEDLLVYAAERMGPKTLAESLGVTTGGDISEYGYEVEFSGGLKSCTTEGDVVVSNQVGMVSPKMPWSLPLLLHLPVEWC